MQAARARPAIWLASFPRSGSTFLRALLAHYFSGRERPLTLTEISAAAVGEHIEDVWLELTGKTGSQRSVEDEWAVRATYLRKIRELANPALPLVKTHTMNAFCYERPAFDFVSGDKIVHIVRDPCAVAVSLAHFRKVSIQEAVTQILTDGCGVAAEPPRHGFDVTGSWKQHTRSWLGVIGTPVLRVRYSDLVLDPAGTLGEVVDFLGHQPQTDRVAHAVRYCEFSRMRQQEATDGFAEAPADTVFFRQGQPFRWPWDLEPSIARRLVSEERDMLDLLGFKDILMRREPGHFNKIYLGL